MWSPLLLAGWIGDDAITPVIGPQDPYFHVSARVGIINLNSRHLKAFCTYF